MLDDGLGFVLLVFALFLPVLVNVFAYVLGQDVLGCLSQVKKALAVSVELHLDCLRSQHDHQGVVRKFGGQVIQLSQGIVQRLAIDPLFVGVHTHEERYNDVSEDTLAHLL